MSPDDLEAVNAAINKLPYKAGVDPLWEPIDADDDGGTCSNFAVAKYRALRALQWPKESLILTCAFVEPFRVQDTPDGPWRDAEKHERYHAFTVVKQDGKLLALDNRKTYPIETHLLPYEWHKLWSWELGTWEWAEGADRKFF